MGAHRRSERPRSLASYGPETGTTYLLHFDRPYGHARHYVGWTQDLAARLQAHARGRGARLVQVVVKAGIGFRLARTWPESTRDREDLIKHAGGARRYCPECGVKPRDQATPPIPAPDRRPMWMADRDGQWDDGTPIIYDPDLTWQQARADRAAMQIPEPGPAGQAELAALDELQRQWTSQEDHVGLKDAAARVADTVRGYRESRQRSASDREADRLWAIADELDKRMGREPGYQHELTAERAARIRARLGEDLARDAHIEAMPRAEGQPLEHWAITPGDVAQAGREPALHGDELDAEIGRLAEAFPEPDEDMWLREGEEPQWTAEQIRQEQMDLVRDNFGPTSPEDLSHLAEEPGRDAATWSPELESTADAEDALRAAMRRGPERPPAAAQGPDVVADYLQRGLEERATAAEALRRLEARALAREHIAQASHDGAGATAAREQAGAFRQARQDAQAEAYGAAAALQEDAAQADEERGWAPLTRAQAAERDPDLAEVFDRAEELAARAAEAEQLAAAAHAELDGYEADTPDHLYGSPECTEADPEGSHFGSLPGEPLDAGRWPVLQPGSGHQPVSQPQYQAEAS